MEGNTATTIDGAPEWSVADERNLARLRADLRETPLRPMEDFAGRYLSRANALSQGHAVLRLGWARGPSPAIDLSGKIPWDGSAKRNRSWSFHLHCWDILDACLLAYSAEPQPEFLSAAMKIAKDWIANFSGFRDQPNFAWYDMAVGVRSVRLAFLIDAAARAEEVDDDEISLLLLSAEQHRSHLADDANFAFHSNHGFYQAAGQAAMANRLGFLTGMAASYGQSCARINVMMDQQFSPEGVHQEHSPDYHRMVVRTLQILIKSGIIRDPHIVRRYETCERSLAWFVVPNGLVLNFGDSDLRQIGKEGRPADVLWQTEEMRWVASQGALGSPPAEQHRFFPEAGYFVVRHRHDEAPSGDTYLALMGAYQSRTHKHADDLSLVWFELGSHILIDSGRYGYLERTQPDSTLWQEGFWYGHPARVYCESTHAHNTIEIDDASYDRRLEKPYGSAIVRAGRSGDLFFAEGHVRHQKSVRHSRTIVLLPRRWLLVADWLGDSSGTQHSFTQWWHFAEGSEVSPLDEGSWEVRVPGLPKPVFVRSVSPVQLTSSIHVGETEPRLQGWWSPSDESLSPATALGIRTSQGESTVAMLALFSLDGQPIVTRTHISASGRSVRLDWNDASSNHSVVIARPSDPDKPFDLRYVSAVLPVTAGAASEPQPGEASG